LVQTGVILLVVLKTRKTTIVAAVFSFCLLVSTVGIVFAESDNWVEVVTFSEDRPRFGETDSFTCDYADWRILWEYEIDEQNLTAFFFEVKSNDTHQLIGNYSNIENLNVTQGIYNITGQIGDFYLDLGINGKSYSITIEQNLDSIPEFPSWIVLPFFLVATLCVFFFKNRFHPSNK